MGNSDIQKEFKNFGLSEVRFTELMHELQAGNEELFEKIFLAQFEEAMNMLRKKYRAEQQDAYDITMDTLIRFRQKLLQQKIHYGNLRFLFFQMCGQSYLKWLRKQAQRKQVLLDRESSDAEPEEELPVHLLERALESLGEGCRALLINFYYDHINLRILANKWDRSETAIRKQKQRCMVKLRGLVQRLLIASN